ncbi:MAG: MBL fold metallo-hydrolase [Ruminococcus sp.]|nr:MBL fold metallo-hydrolase [Ruminococcus sp.]
MRITVLAENTSNYKNLGCEHGLSLYIEIGKHKLLFDMGQSELFYENAKKLNIDLTQVDIAVLSHGHYDHGGGLKKFLQINSKAKVYLSNYAFEPHYNGEKYIGLDVTLKDSDRLVFVGDELEIADGLTLFSCNNEWCKWDINSGGLSVLKNDEKIPDPFLHEQYLLIEENEHKVLISGCSHKGILNLNDWFAVDTIVGGLHVSKWSDDSLESLAKMLNFIKVSFYTCHCTGVEQFKFMKERMKRLHYISTGDVIELI